MKKLKPEAYIDEWSKLHFDRICVHLENADALNEIDSYGLSIMAQYLKMYHEAANAVNESGTWQVFANGASNVSGAFSVMEKCAAQFLKFSEKFGLSEKDREKMLKFNIAPRETDDLDDIESK